MHISVCVCILLPLHTLRNHKGKQSEVETPEDLFLNLCCHRSFHVGGIAAG